MKTKERKRMGAAALLLAVIIFSTAALAQSLVLMPPSLANMHGRLTAQFGVNVEALPILKGELEDGAELVLTCDIGLYRNNDYWMDDEITSETFISSLKYDALTQEYVMTLPKESQPLRNKDIGALLQEGWGDIEVSLGSWALLDRGEKYSLRLHTSMNQKDAPDGVMRFIYFWSWDAGAQNSFQLDFTY